MLRHEEIENDLLIPGPFSAVCEDEYGLDLMFPEVPCSGILQFLVCEFSEGRSVLVVFDDIAGCDHVFEAVAFSYVPALVALASNHEDGSILRCHLFHWRMAADKLPRRDLQLELTA